jgi:hypothetical protein
MREDPKVSRHTSPQWKYCSQAWGNEGFKILIDTFPTELNLPLGTFVRIEATGQTAIDPPIPSIVRNLL